MSTGALVMRAAEKGDAGELGWDEAVTVDADGYPEGMLPSLLALVAGCGLDGAWATLRGYQWSYLTAGRPEPTTTNDVLVLGVGVALKAAPPLRPGTKSDPWSDYAYLLTEAGVFYSNRKTTTGFVPWSV